MKTFVLAFDLHVPHQHQSSWDAVLDFLKHNRVDGFVFGGDALDLGSISHWNRSKPALRGVGSLRKDLELFDKIALSKVEKLLPPGAEKVYMIGNHEAWLDISLLEDQPELSGLLSVEGCLNLKTRGWKVIPQGGFHKIGNLYVVHGDAIGGGQNPAKKAVDTYCSAVAFGHYHFSQSFTKIAPSHLDQRWTAYAMPCLCDRAPAYAKGRGNSWQHGVGIAEVRSNGAFNLHTCLISEGQFSYGGRLYGHRKYRPRKAA